MWFRRYRYRTDTHTDKRSLLLGLYRCNLTENFDEILFFDFDIQYHCALTENLDVILFDIHQFHTKNLFRQIEVRDFAISTKLFSRFFSRFSQS